MLILKYFCGHDPFGGTGLCCLSAVVWIYRVICIGLSFLALAIGSVGAPRHIFRQGSFRWSEETHLRKQKLVFMS